MNACDNVSVDDDVDRCETNEAEEIALSSKLNMWHRRLGPIYWTDLSKLCEHVDGISVSVDDSGLCECCELNKRKRRAIPSDCGTRAQDILEYVHADILGPVAPVSVDGHRYAIGFVDSCSRYRKVYFLKNREKALKNCNSFVQKRESLLY